MKKRIKISNDFDAWLRQAILNSMTSDRGWSAEGMSWDIREIAEEIHMDRRFSGFYKLAPLEVEIRFFQVSFEIQKRLVNRMVNSLCDEGKLYRYNGLIFKND